MQKLNQNYRALTILGTYCIGVNEEAILSAKYSITFGRLSGVLIALV